MRPNVRFPADMVTFTEKFLNGKLHFLCSALTTLSWSTRNFKRIFCYYIQSLSYRYYWQNDTKGKNQNIICKKCIRCSKSISEYENVEHDKFRVGNSQNILIIPVKRHFCVKDVPDNYRRGRKKISVGT